MNGPERYAATGARVKEEWIRVNEQVQVRLLRFEPAKEEGRLPLVLVPGLSTIIESFKDILLELTRDFPVYYLETRENQLHR